MEVKVSLLAGKSQSDLEADHEEDEDDQPRVPTESQKWYSKASYLVDHVNKVSRRLCRHPGFALAIDEMMKRFKGRSPQTVRMRHKPIKEGYKFFAMCCTQSGYIFAFFPDGRLETAPIVNCVNKLVNTLPSRDVRRYVIAMDNYFTTSNVMEQTRLKNVGVVGTARYRRGWPAEEIREVNDSRFNTLYLLNDVKNFLILRWIDNNVVTMVSTIHTGYETAIRLRWKPRENQVNKAHVRNVWGELPVIPISIPKVIDNYNHWMGGVDLADQYISYYRPNIRCRRTWMPIFLHCLDIIRVNAYLVAKLRDPKLKHKTFVVDWIEALNKRADAIEYGNTRQIIASLKTPPSTGKRKRMRMSHTRPDLPEYRRYGGRSEHQVCIGLKQRNCTYCAYLYALAKLDGSVELPVVRTPARYCSSSCQDHLCNDHFDVFHGWG